MDDNITGGTTANVWETDNLELKFDPQPTDSVTNSIWDTRLTAPGVTLSDDLSNVAAENKQFARTNISGGYTLELAIKWSAIGTTETITPAIDQVFGLAINFHDNDGAGRAASVMWAAVMLDAVWNTPKYLGTVKFLGDNKLQFIPSNNMTGVYNVIPYDGRDTTVSVEKAPGIPTEFSLSQNYPNPFNPSTSIEFAIPTQSMVELEVYNLLGERIALLISEELPAGFYKTSFSGSTLPSGIYFYRIKAGSFVETKKLMLLK
jgi:hypothetical protein